MFWIGFLCGFILAPILILIVIIVLLIRYISKDGIPFAH
jgi:hypothetical protein